MAYYGIFKLFKKGTEFNYQILLTSSCIMKPDKSNVSLVLF